MLFVLALIFAAPEGPPPQNSVYVSREQFDCFVREAGAGRGGYEVRRTYYLDLRRCPGAVTAAPRRLPLYPRVGRPNPPASIYPNVAGTTRGGQPYRTVVAVSGRELNCLTNNRSRAAVVRPASDGRYELDLTACR